MGHPTFRCNHPRFTTLARRQLVEPVSVLVIWCRFAPFAVAARTWQFEFTSMCPAANLTPSVGLLRLHHPRQLPSRLAVRASESFWIHTPASRSMVDQQVQGC